MSNMHEYRKRVKDAAVKRDGVPLYNGSPDHAAILTETLFEFAKSEVCILTGKLDAHIYGRNDVLEKVRAFLSVPQKKVRVLVERPTEIDEADHPFIREFKDSNDIEIRALPSTSQQKYHFTVVDSDSYRFESDKDQVTAVAAFGDNNGGKRLSEVFEILWRSAPSDNLFPQSEQ